MTLEILLQPLVYGLQIGVSYILLALGLTVIFSIMNVINLAHGEFYMQRWFLGCPMVLECRIRRIASTPAE